MITKPRLIGLGYRARSGKDTVGAHLCNSHGYKRVAFADKMKEVASVLTGDDAFGEDFKTEATILGVTGGQLLQELNTLKQIHPDIWHRCSHLRELVIMGASIVVTDVRFTADAQFIKRLGGQLWRIDRPGLAYDPHSSETEGASVVWDRVIVNNSTVPALLLAVDAVLVDLAPVNVVG